MTEPTTPTSPAELVRDAIVSHLASQLGLTEGQVRGVLDVSGKPKDEKGCVVACSDQGDHPGCAGRVLVDVRPTVVVFTHLEQDPDGSVCDALAASVLSSMQSITYSISGWSVAWTGSWQVTEATMDGSFRQESLSATLPLVKQQ